MAMDGHNVRTVLFQGDHADAVAARAHLTGLLEQRGCTALPAKSGQVELRLPLGGASQLVVGRSAHAPSGLAATLLVTDPGGADEEDLTALLDVVEALPFTDAEVGRFVADLPILAAAAEQAGPCLFEGVSVLVCIHHMRDFAGMLAALLAAGADPATMTVLDKGYPYLHRQRVDGWLRHRHQVTLITYPDRVAGIGAHLKRAAVAGMPTLVIDDGGYVLPVILDHFPHRIGDVVGVVEQTSSGIWRLADYGPLVVPVFSVAESSLKAAVEAPHVAAAAIAATMRWFPDETWAGRPALVNGYGRLGREAARQLRDRHRMRVTVHDPSTAALVTAHQDGFAVAGDLTSVIGEHRPLLVLGCAGRKGLTVDHAAAFTSSAYLASMTSRDFEFPLAGWADKAERVLDLGPIGHSYHLPGGIQLVAVADGLPVNFHHAESLPGRVIDLVMAALFTGAATLLQPGHGGHGPGTNVPFVDRILADSPALRLYLDRYADEERRVLAVPDPALCGPYQRSPWIYGTP